MLALAPMHEVTDTVFRRIIASIQKPDVMMTEFVSVDGLCHASSCEKIKKYYLTYDANERPLVAQLWGKEPALFEQAARMVVQLGFDGVDVNMGCPDKRIVSFGGGAALIKNLSLAKEIIEATKKGADTLPVSVKTRIGFDSVEESDAWILGLIDAQPSALTVHGRTKKELSKKPVHWDIIGRYAKEAIKKEIVYLGNGDVFSRADAIEKIEKYNLSGIMIGRGALGNPWIFSGKTPSLEEKLLTAKKHALLFEQTFSGTKPFSHIMKHLHAYIAGFRGAKALREQVMKAKNANEVSKYIQNFLHDSR